MQFKHPEILYFLFALLVPIIVHLFQLRRFKTAYFTNVRMLLDIKFQTRKSAKIKKWLLLATRMLLFTCIIFAFAQPYFSSTQLFSSKVETYVILDNSYSMQAKGNKGELLKRSIEELLAQLPENLEFSLLTANEAFWNVTPKSIQKELQHLAYSPISFSLERALTQINAASTRCKKNILVVSDGLINDAKLAHQLDSNSRIWYVRPQAEQKNNTAIDSVYVTNHSNDFYTIAVKLKQYGALNQSIPLTVYDQNKIIAKSIVQLDSTNKIVKIPLPKKEFNGYVQLTDQSLAYDNTLFFTIMKPKQIKVLCIGDESTCNFLRRIYTAEEFVFTNQALEHLDFNAIEQNDVLVCNELPTISGALQSSIKDFATQGGTVLLIPSNQPGAQPSFAELLNKFGTFEGITLDSNPQLITQIAFEHPIYQSAFEKSIRNFDYPKTNTNYTIKSTFMPVLRFANQQAFLLSGTVGAGHIYVFTAALNTTNSTFQQSPLIVPTFYNMASIHQAVNQTYSIIGKSKQLLVDATAEKDEILAVKNSTANFIPQQQLAGKKTLLSCGDNPNIAGNYSVFKGQNFLQNLSFNYAREESNLFATPINLGSRTAARSIESVFDQWEFNPMDSDVWKWFVFLALLFVGLEVFIQKYVS